jgi:hypothetical protein
MRAGKIGNARRHSAETAIGYRHPARREVGHAVDGAGAEPVRRALHCPFVPMLPFTRWATRSARMADDVNHHALETRRSLVRVWLAISAVWVAFWLLMAAAAAAQLENPFVTQARLFSLIVALPPAALLLTGFVGRVLIHAVAMLRRQRIPAAK